MAKGYDWPEGANSVMSHESCGMVQSVSNRSLLLDAVHLTALKALTHLSLTREAPKVDETVMACLALELTNLEQLHIDGYQSAAWSTAASPAVGKLTKYY